MSDRTRHACVFSAAALLLLGAGCGLDEDLPAAGDPAAEPAPGVAEPVPRAQTAPYLIATPAETGDEVMEPADRRPDPQVGGEASGCHEPSLPHRPELVRHLPRPVHPSLLPLCRDVTAVSPLQAPSPGMLQRREEPQPTTGN
jgi:hypothetical protein